MAYKIHVLKTWPEFFDMVKNQGKRVEIRVNDRSFEVADFLYLREYDEGEFTGRSLVASITHVLGMDNLPGIKVTTDSGHPVVAMSFEIIE